MNGFKIEAIGLEDVLTLKKVSVETFIETFAATNTREDLDNYLRDSFSIEKLLSELSNPGSQFFLISETSSYKVAGYLKLNTGNAQNEFTSENSLEIERIYVLHEFHGKGVGQALLNFSIAKAIQFKKEFIWLGVWENNERAKAFYFKNGFAIIGKHTFVLGSDKQTDLLMKRAI
ncbi:MAG: GNAT family N-acetyltransferase [Cyclobacteriaceae bacterium]|jgi:ribosomal protein S18 acetylase RimI-like enzyme|nr:GNAT family N-acetyltransferase [Cyclobacteriaceae bacterium]